MAVRGTPMTTLYATLPGALSGASCATPQARKGHEWLWMITAREIKPSTANRGYAATRDKAMAEFKARWLSELK